MSEDVPPLWKGCLLIRDEEFHGGFLRACAPLNVLACAEQDQPDAGLQVRIATKRAVDPWHLGIRKFIAGFEVDFEYRPTNLEWPEIGRAHF